MKQKLLIIGGALVLAVGVIIYFIVRQVTSPSSPDEQEKVTCGNKTVYRYKYPSKAFPLVANDYDAEIKFTSDVLKKLVDSAGSIDIGVNVKNQVQELQEKLNQDNITFSTGLRNYFYSVNADPCNDTLRNHYAAFTEEMSRRMLELRTITSQVATVTEPVTAAHEMPNDSTATERLPKYKLIKDTANIRQSILKLTNIIQNNQRVNFKMVQRVGVIKG